MCVLNGHYSGIEIAIYNPPGAEKRERDWERERVGWVGGGREREERGGGDTGYLKGDGNG